MSTRFQAQCFIPTCDDHNGEELDIYCYTCKKSICFDCSKSSHISHQQDKIAKIARKFRQEAENMSNTSTGLSNLQGELEQIKTVGEVNNMVMENEIKAINRCRKKVHAQVDVIADIIIATIKKDVKQRQEDLQAAKPEVEKDIEELTKMLNRMKDPSQTLGDHTTLQLKIEYERKISQLAKTKRVTDPYEKHLHYIEGEIIQDQLKSMLGKVIKNDPSAIQISEKKTFVHGQENIIDVAPVSDDLAWIHGYNHKQIDLVDKEGFLKESKNLGIYCDMFTISENGDIFFTYFNGCVISKLDNKGVRSKFMDTSPLKPQGISLTLDGDLLVTLCDDYQYELKEKSRRIVQHITKNGQEKVTYEYDTDGSTRLFTFPLRARQNYNGDICVADITSTKSGRVCLLGADGKKKSTYSGQNLRNKFIPHDVCCDRTCNMIIADLNNKAIHLLNPKGQFVKMLLRDEAGPKFPRSLGMHKSGLWIGCGKGTCMFLEYEYK